VRSVLITGGSGFFGRAFAGHVLRENLAERVCIYSRSEYRQYEMREQMDDPRLRFFIGDVRDRDRLRRAMEGCDVIIHAAALKRIEVGAYNPGEMVKTNVVGTVNVIEAATDAGAEKVVLLSTDKAFEPVSPYGQTKALAESLVLAANNSRGKAGPRFSVTRYGNVAGSTGSVIPVWRKCVGIVPVTDPDCTRFYMTAQEAVDLVLDVIEEMPDCPAIPELPAFRLGDLAEAMNLKMEVKGLGAYEKKHESMCEALCSSWAPRLTVPELRERLGAL
jgi:UDP-N-acetylglucosamine 4,6-dehydratase